MMVYNIKYSMEAHMQLQSCGVSNQGIFISEMEWVPLKCLFGNANDSILKLTVSITRSDSLCYRPCYKTMLNHNDDENLQQLKSKFCFIVEQMLVFVWSTKFGREVKNLSPNF